MTHSLTHSLTYFHLLTHLLTHSLTHSLIRYDESRVVETEAFYRTYDHFYTRPSRVAFLYSTGLIFIIVLFVSGMCLYVNEDYYRRRFYKRVYVD